MSTLGSEREAQKAEAAAHAAQLVRDGMLLGLGTGSTARHFVRDVGRLVRSGMRIRAVATSAATVQLAREAGIELVEPGNETLDLAVDGADEIDPQRSLIKGRGGALFREKLVAISSRRFVVIADGSKLVEQLGRGPVPVEVLPFFWRRTASRLESLGCTWTLRGGDQDPFRTDNANLILDLQFETGGIADAAGLGAELKSTVGVLEHGLYIGIATACIVAGESGIEILGSLD